MTDGHTEEVRDEMLMALADGELDDTQAAALRARIAADPELAARHAVFSETAVALRAAFAQDAVPAHLVDAVERAPMGRDPNDGNVVPVRARAAAWPLALAASLALGIGLGWGLKGADAPDAGPSLAEVAQAVSGVPTGGSADVASLGAARVLGSFETQRGLCRLIAVTPVQGDHARFVACRDAGGPDATGWDVALSVADGQDDGYSPAADTATLMIDLYLDAVGAGPALDAAQEAEALQRDPD